MITADVQHMQYIQHFDTLNYVEQSKALGVDENVAKYQARQIEQAIDIAVNTAKTDLANKELATKHDILELKEATKHDILELKEATKHDILELKNNIKELDLKIELVKKEIIQIQKELELKIENEVHKTKFELIQWIAGFFVASGLIQHFFK